MPYPGDRGERFRSFYHPGTPALDDRLAALTGDADDGTVEPVMIAYAERVILPR